jgi:hypothetical protein
LFISGAAKKQAIEISADQVAGDDGAGARLKIIAPNAHTHALTFCHLNTRKHCSGAAKKQAIENAADQFAGDDSTGARLKAKLAAATLRQDAVESTAAAAAAVRVARIAAHFTCRAHLQCNVPKHVHICTSAIFICQVPCSSVKCHVHLSSAMFICQVPCSSVKCHVHLSSAMFTCQVPCSSVKCHVLFFIAAADNTAWSDANAAAAAVVAAAVAALTTHNLFS